MSDQLSTVYNPKETEEQALKVWEMGNCFHAVPGGSRVDETYVIVIPPPNVTAALHLGHALNNTLQDILVRYQRMRGLDTLWMPGTDHAGIATQTVVEKRLLAEQGKRRTDFEREEFVGHVQDWKDEYEARILGQLKRMGCSCDWQRVRFTMDDMCARAVRANFFNLFRDGLIYRGKRLVNWDPATQTVLADDEVEHERVAGHFYYMRYPLEEAVEFEGKTIRHVTVATTRPETMLGDTGVAMHPGDPRAGVLGGKKVRLPIVGRLIPIVLDEHVVLPDPESEDEKARFSSGFLKVTPAHDTNDWEIGIRHGLDVINVMAPDGTISDRHGWEDAGEDAEFLLGMDRFEARNAIVEWFRKEKLLEEIRDYEHEVGHSYRSHVPIEPYLSDQWYVAVKKPISHLAEKFGEGMIEDTDVPYNSLAGLALAPLMDKRLKFYPDRYARNYRMWLENLRDWPISRQLWWGHQIPVWNGKQEPDLSGVEACVQEGTDENGEKVYFVCVPADSEDAETKLESQGLVRDEDVLDTWFSSALWPFSTMGWPGDTPEMGRYYPGSVLCTAREIITLWVSRMVMMGQYCAGDIPFRDVYIHAMIQDGQGRKMSKSLGNGIDPLVVIDSHGADAMRFTLASMTTDTQDVRMPVEPMKLPDGREVNTSPKFDNGRNFCNKLWNASRFAMMHLEGMDAGSFDEKKMDLSDRWILSRLAGAVKKVSEGLDAYKYNEPATELYRFFWNDVCDWYLEWCKPRMNDAESKGTAQNVLAFVLDQSLRLLHPIVPFITEGIYEKLRGMCPKIGIGTLAKAETADALVTGAWPGAMNELIDGDAEEKIETLQGAIKAIREIRNKYTIAPTEKVKASISGPADLAAMIEENAPLVCSLAGVSDFEVSTSDEKPSNAAVSVVGELSIFVHDVVDPEEERKRLLKQKEHIEKGLRGAEGKLGNENFMSRAKPEIIERTRQQAAELKEQLGAVCKLLDELS